MSRARRPSRPATRAAELHELDVEYKELLIESRRRAAGSGRCIGCGFRAPSGTGGIDERGQRVRPQRGGALLDRVRMLGKVGTSEFAQPIQSNYPGFVWP